MKSTRRLLSILLCLIMCLSMLPTAFAADNIMAAGKAGSDAEFKLYTDGRLVINGTGTVMDMEHWSFTTSYSFSDDAVKATRSETKSVVIGEGITDIDMGAFAACPNLKTASLPKSLLTIGIGAFAYSGLNKITIPAGVYMIDAGAFEGCASLTGVTFSSTITLSISQTAFKDCTNLTSVVFPNTLGYIGANAFQNSGLKSITFQGNYASGMIDSTAFTGVTANVYYPVDNNTWNEDLDPFNPANAALVNFGGHLHWVAQAAQTQSDGWVKKTIGGKDVWYYYVGGKMLVNSWKAYGGEWFYFGSDGKMLQGRQKVGNDYYYFGVEGVDAKVGARLSGKHGSFYYGEDGKWQQSYGGVDDSGLDYYTNGWQKVNGKWFFIRNKAKVTGWLYSLGYWYYLDPTTGAMVTGWLTVGGKTYYLRPYDKAKEDGIPDKEGSMIAGCSSTIGGSVYTFDASGALQGGKMDNNPLGYENGFRKEGPYWYFYRSDGRKATGWELVNKFWYYFDSNGKMLTGWQYVNGRWYYMTPSTGSGDPRTSDTGKMVTGFNTIPVTKTGINTTKTYYFDGSGALGGNGWIKVGLRWYYLKEDGVQAVGWIRDGTKWYYLSDGTSKNEAGSTIPKGEMVTGTVNTTINTPDSPGIGNHTFAANGEWLGKVGSSSGIPSTAGEWKLEGGKWYYYDAHGNKLSGWQHINGEWYYLNPSDNKAMVTGWQNIGGKRYFFNASGAEQSGWQNLDGNWYYLWPNHDGHFGELQVGWNFIDNEWYFMAPMTAPNPGAVQSGWHEVTAADSSGWAPGWYYLNPNHDGHYGMMHHGGWMELNGKWYYFHNAHDGAWGRLEQGEWISDGGNWYYMNASSRPEESWMVTGWNSIGGKWYYMNGSGAVLSGWQQIGGKWYYLHPAHDGHFGEMYASTTVDGYTIDANGVANR